MNNKLLNVYPDGIEISDEELYNKVKNCNLSPSMANSFLNCPADWFLDKYILPRLEHEEPIFFARGTAFHKVMEHFFSLDPEKRNPKMLAKVTLVTLRKEYPELNNDPDSVEWMKNAIRGYLQMNFDYKDDIIPMVNLDGRGNKIGLELFVSAKFGTEHKVLGFIDKLAKQNTNTLVSSLVMQDWKTGKKVHNYDPNKKVSYDNSFDYWRQQTLYAMMLEQKGIELSDASLIFPVAKEVVHVDWTNKNVQDLAIEDMQKLDKALTKCINDNFFPFTPALFCTWCHLLYKGRVPGRSNPPKINPNEFNQLVEYKDSHI